MPGQKSWKRVGLAVCAAFFAVRASAAVAEGPGSVPPGFTSANVAVLGTTLHYVRGGSGPAVVLVHGFPENWTEYRAILPRLARQFTVVAVDLPGIGESAPSKAGYDSANLAAHLHAMVDALKLKQPYVVGHDLGGIVTYAYLRRFPESLRGAMIVDVPMPGIAGWDESVAGMWHIGFIQAPGLAEKLVTGRQSAFLGYILDIGKFTPEKREYYFKMYDAPQLHAAFEIYRGFPADARWNAAQSAVNSVPLTLAVGEKSFFAPRVNTLIEGYRAKGMKHVESAQVGGSSHYVLADNPDAVAELIERQAASGGRPGSIE